MEKIIEWRKQSNIRQVVLANKEHYYIDLINIEHSWTGRYDGNICNTFVMEAEKQESFLDAWKSTADFPMQGQMIKQLSQQGNIFVEMKSQMPEFFLMQKN